ncbi:hypothetical protein [Autumnicola musiva]|uniref:Uncharacterized protein n=1 Tax=Autumnicola musiva TaxID=3075589 RepID=A0ABU3D0D5_9FLAO|nr:hypothetical protein [Zunongwangia sp. F117]MDT0674998.1 hypothetical protein [Zunongwangia sp. F117]
MNKQDLFTGFLVGVAANISGIFLYILIFSELNIDATLQDAFRNGYLGKLIALGGIPNFLPFFLFLKKKHNAHARGVLMASILAAISVGIFKIAN